MTVPSFEISGLEDLERIAAEVGLPVGPRTGANKRTQEKKEWYVVLGFLKKAIPADIFEVPMTIRRGVPPDEPDFVVTRSRTCDVVGLVEITEATDEADQREMTAFERSALVGHSGGRFSRGAARPGLAWASDIIDAIKRKETRVIFKSSLTPRHLIIYPNSNASLLLADQLDQDGKNEREAVGYLREAVDNSGTLAEITNGCFVHVLGNRHICFDVVGDMRVLHRD
jgi:hypothetical protein